MRKDVSLDAAAASSKAKVGQAIYNYEEGEDADCGLRNMKERSYLASSMTNRPKQTAPSEPRIINSKN